MAASEDESAAGRLSVWLRIIGAIDLLAAIPVFLPAETLAAIHGQLDLGTWPEAEIAAYLARSASWMYALCGALFWFLSNDVVRYRPLIRFVAACGVVTGFVLVGIDLLSGMPGWWTAAEGPGCILLAVITGRLARTSLQERGVPAPRAAPDDPTPRFRPTLRQRF